MRFALAVLFTGLLALTGLSATITVPDDHATIQAALQSAGSGDTIVVRPGVYVENINFLGKAVVLTSEKGPGLTTIDGSNPSDPNRASTVTFDSGEGPATRIEGFTITGGTGTLVGRDTYGGGVFCNNASRPVIRGNIIRDNGEVFLGGGIQCTRSTPLIDGNRIYHNRAKYGGGIQMRNFAHATIVNNMIFRNEGPRGGAGIRSSFSSYAVITNNTVVRNLKGGGIFVTTCSPSTITNNIVRENAGNEIISARGSAAPPDVTFCNVEGGWTGLGNFDKDPLFADIDGFDYHLRFDSPCRDAGTMNTPSLPATDGEGDPRVTGNSADIGADEFYNHLYRQGVVVPGGTVQLKVTGSPGRVVRIGLGLGGLLANPHPTPHGLVYLAQPRVNLGADLMPPEGVVAFPAAIPAVAPVGTEFPLQAFVGVWGNAQSGLTNALVLTVQ